jgi:hypothetical protein
MEETIYFFSGDLIVGNKIVRHINGIFRKQVNTKEFAVELLKDIEVFIINQIRKDYPLQEINFQVNNISILGQEKFDKSNKLNNYNNEKENEKL